MRALVVHPGPDFSTADVFAGWLEGLKAIGVDARAFNLGTRLTFFEHADAGGKRLTSAEAVDAVSELLLARCYRLWPHVLVVICGVHLNAEVLDLIRQRGTKVVIVHTESPYEDDRQIGLVAYADIHLLNDPACIESWRAVHPEVWYSPHCWRPNFHTPGPSTRKSDVCFIGTDWPERVEFLEAIDWSGIDLALAGRWDALGDDSPIRRHIVAGYLDNAETVDLYRGSRVGFNLYRRYANRDDLAQGWSMGPREVEMAACGLFFARQPRPEGDAVLSMLPTFTEPQELGDIIRWALSHEDECRAIAEDARAAVADRTFDLIAARLMARLEAL